MKSIIQFTISKEDGVYTASALDIPVVTQAQSLDELAANIREATALYFEDENMEELGFNEHPSVLVNFELPVEHAGA